MKHLGVLIFLALAWSYGSGAARHRHETSVLQDAPDYRDEQTDESLDDSQTYQQSVAFDEDDPVASSNIKTIFGANRQPQPQRTRPRSRPLPRFRSTSSGAQPSAVVRRTRVQPRAQQPCPQALAARPSLGHYPPPFMPYGGYPTLPWWPSWGNFPGFPVIYVPVPVCNCTSQEESVNPAGIGTRDGVTSSAPPSNYDDYDDIAPAPLDFTPASTSRPLNFKPPKVEHTPTDDNQVQEQVPQRPSTRRPPPAGATRPGEPRCARAIVNCCELQVDVKCFEIFGCEGAFFGDPCVYYERALTILTNYSKNNK